MAAVLLLRGVITVIAPVFVFCSVEASSMVVGATVWPVTLVNTFELMLLIF